VLIVNFNSSNSAMASVQWRHIVNAITITGASSSVSSNIQNVEYTDIQDTLKVLSFVESWLIAEEEGPNPRQLILHYLRQIKAKLQEKLNYQIEDFLNTIGLFD